MLEDGIADDPFCAKGGRPRNNCADISYNNNGDYNHDDDDDDGDEELAYDDYSGKDDDYEPTTPKKQIQI